MYRVKETKKAIDKLKELYAFHLEDGLITEQEADGIYYLLEKLDKGIKKMGA